MKIVSCLVFLTLVGWPFLVRAEPHSDAPPENPSLGETQNSYEKVNPDIYNNFSITPVAPARPGVDEFIHEFNRDDYYHNYRQALSPHVGALAAFVDSTDDKDLMQYDLGVIWELPKHLSPKWEIGLDWTTFSLGQITVDRKHIFNEKGAFRPFYKYGITNKVVPKEQLASASNFDNYLLRLGVGFESIIRPPRSVRLDLDVAVGTEDVWVLFYYGYSWAW